MLVRQCISQHKIFHVKVNLKLTWGGEGGGEGSTHLVEADHQAKPNTSIQHPFFLLT